MILCWRGISGIVAGERAQAEQGGIQNGFQKNWIIETIPLHQTPPVLVDVVLTRPGCSLTKPEPEKLADGRIFNAEQAGAARSIDRAGYLDDTVAAMKMKLNLKEAKVIAYYRPGSYRGTIYSGSAVEAPSVVNLINVNADGLELLSGTEFMYLWEPGSR